jgi:hypothetical protein
VVETEETPKKLNQATRKNKARAGNTDEDYMDQDTETDQDLDQDTTKRICSTLTDSTSDQDSDAETVDTVELTKRLHSKCKPKAVQTDSSQSTNAGATRSKTNRKRDAKARKVRTPQEVAYDFTLY